MNDEAENLLEHIFEIFRRNYANLILTSLEAHKSDINCKDKPYKKGLHYYSITT